MIQLTYLGVNGGHKQGGPLIASKAKPGFDPKAFVAKASGGWTMSKYRKNQTVFSQGDPADFSIFTFMTTRSKSPSSPSKGRKPSLLSWGRMHFAARVV